jgi:hypothetical protein
MMRKTLAGRDRRHGGGIPRNKEGTMCKSQTRSDKTNEQVVQCASRVRVSNRFPSLFTSQVEGS